MNTKIVPLTDIERAALARDLGKADRKTRETFARACARYQSGERFVCVLLELLPSFPPSRRGRVSAAEGVAVAIAAGMVQS